MNQVRKNESVKKMTIGEIKEALDRENSLLKNRTLVNKLPDKGEAIKLFCGLLQSELKYREDLETIERNFKEMTIADPNVEIHTQRLCNIERIPEKERYKPFATLNTFKKTEEGSKIFKIIEDCKQNSKPSKLISLAESIRILKEQGAKVKEGQIQTGIKRLRTAMRGQDSSSSSSECSDYASDQESDNLLDLTTEK